MRAQVGDACNRSRKVHFVFWKFSWTQPGLAIAHFIKGSPTTRIQTPGAGRGACALPKQISQSVLRGDVRKRRPGGRRAKLDRESLVQNHDAARRSRGN